MTPVTQQPNGCYAACIASITGIPLDAIPHPKDDDPLTSESWRLYRNGLVQFLKEHGWWLAFVPAVDGWSAPTGYSIASGPGPRGYDHACVALDGHIVWDPHPTGGGLVSVGEYEVLIRLVRSQHD